MTESAARRGGAPRASTPRSREVAPDGGDRGRGAVHEHRLGGARATAPRCRARRSRRRGRARARPDTSPRIENSASRTRSAVGRVRRPAAWTQTAAAELAARRPSRSGFDRRRPAQRSAAPCNSARSSRAARRAAPPRRPVRRSRSVRRIAAKPTGASRSTPSVPLRSRSPSTTTSIRSVSMLHGAGDHLTGDLSAGREGAEQQIARTRRGARAPHAGVSLRLLDGPPEVDGAAHRPLCLATPGGERDLRCLRVLPVALLERRLHLLEVHGGSIARGRSGRDRVQVRAEAVDHRAAQQRVLGLGERRVAGEQLVGARPRALQQLRRRRAAARRGTRAGRSGACRAPPPPRAAPGRPRPGGSRRARRAIASSRGSLGSPNRMQSDWCSPRPTRPRSWCSWERP